MSDREESAGYEPEEDLEILEVVGMDREAAPPSPRDSELPPELPEETLITDPEPLLVSDDEMPQAAGATEEEQQLLRLRADYDNLRKRIDRERQEFELHANSRLVARLLPIVDNFERALAAGPSNERERAFRDGCVMIYKQLLDELRRQGLKAIDAEGHPFDPEVHDAVATDAASDEPHNTVVEELRRGYLFRNRLLRPAMVKVSTNGNGNGNGDGDGNGDER